MSDKKTAAIEDLTSHAQGLKSFAAGLRKDGLFRPSRRTQARSDIRSARRGERRCQISAIVLTQPRRHRTSLAQRSIFVRERLEQLLRNTALNVAAGRQHRL